MPFKAHPAPSSWLEERRLLADVKAGKEGALQTFAREHAARLHRLALELAPDTGSADQLLDAALLHALSWSPVRREDQPLGPWLCEVLLSRWRALSPARPQTEPAGELPRRPVADWSSLASDPEARDKLASALAGAGKSLPPHLRSTWMLCDVLGLALAEAGQALDLAAGLAKGRLHRARLILREELAATAARLGAGEGGPGPGGAGEAGAAAPSPLRGRSSGMECGDFAARLRAGAGGELTDTRQNDWEAHRRACGDCGALHRTYARVIDLARRAAAPDPPTGDLAARVAEIAARARAAAVPAEDTPPHGETPGGTAPAAS